MNYVTNIVQNEKKYLIWLNWLGLHKSILLKSTWSYTHLLMAVYLLSTIFVPNLFNRIVKFSDLQKIP